MLTKGAIGNLLNRYKAVLEKCNLLNTFGSLAVASMLVLGGAGAAEAAKTSIAISGQNNIYDLTNLPPEGKFTGYEDSSANGGVFDVSNGAKLEIRGANDSKIEFSDNFAKKHGSVIHGSNSCTVDIDYATFVGNTAQDGAGVIFINGGSASNTPVLDIRNSDFTKNVCSYDGGPGAVRMNYGTLTITNTTFCNNASKQGTAGALYLLGTTATLSGVTFKYNSASSNNGAGAIGNFDKATLNLKGSNSFQGNSAMHGGAIYNAKPVGWMEERTSGGDVTISGYTAFNNNKASQNGGAIYNGNNITIENADFINNRSGKNGGAIYNDKIGNGIGLIEFTGNVYFAGNTAGGTISNTGTADEPVYIAANATPNDIHNLGIISVKNGATIRLDGGYIGNGYLFFDNGSTLEVADASKLIEYPDAGLLPSPLLDGRSSLSSTTAEGMIAIKSGAKLKLNNIASNTTYRIADNFAYILQNYELSTSGSQITLQLDTDDQISTPGTKLAGWNGENLISDTSLLLDAEAKLDAEGDGIIVEVTTAENPQPEEPEQPAPVTPEDVKKLLPDVIPANALVSIMNSGIDTGSDFMGRRFLSRATDTDYLSAKPAEPATAAPAMAAFAMRAAPAPVASVDEAALRATAVKLINEVARAAVTVGVQNTSLRISDAAADLSLDHLSLANHNKASSFHSRGSDFWAAPLYGNMYSSGMTLNSDSVRGQFGGLALGADTEIGQIAGGKMRLGAALHGGGGQSETKGTLTTAQNDYDFGGLSFYAGWNKGAFNLIGSLGYGFGNHEVEMALPSSIDMGVAKADIDTSAFTADLRAEYELKAGWLNVVPHIGLRYTMLKTDAHELSVPGGVMTEFAADTQNIMQFPIGVALSADTTFGGWTVKPGADVSFIPACGETDAYTRMHFTGVDAWDSVNSRIMDSTSYAAELSLKAEKGNFSLGLSYGVQASSHETDQNIQVKFGWKF